MAQISFQKHQYRFMVVKWFGNSSTVVHCIMLLKNQSNVSAMRWNALPALVRLFVRVGLAHVWCCKAHWVIGEHGHAIELCLGDCYL